MQRIIEAEKSGLFDGLAYVQRAFVDFVLAQYVSQGVDELDADKLSPLLKLKYQNAFADALADLGRPEQVRRVFVGFQRPLCQREPCDPASQHHLSRICVHASRPQAVPWFPTSSQH